MLFDLRELEGRLEKLEETLSSLSGPALGYALCELRDLKEEIEERRLRHLGSNPDVFVCHCREAVVTQSDVEPLVLSEVERRRLANTFVDRRVRVWLRHIKAKCDYLSDTTLQRYENVQLARR